MRGIALSPVLDGRVQADRSPGEVFADAVRETPPGHDIEVAYGIHLPAAFPLFASRPRYTVRHLMKTAAVADAPVPYVYEPPAGRLRSGSTYATTPEAAFASRLAHAGLTDISVAVPLPAGLLDEPELLATFVDLRVLVRLSARENDVLLNGTADGVITGLLRLPGTRSRAAEPDLVTAVTAAAADVENTGGSCDGIVAHPDIYWQLVRHGALDRLNAAGITVSRTRMIPPHLLLLGDFSAATTLLLPGVGSIAVRRGAGPDGGDLIEASTRVGLAVRLPQHLMTMELSR
ncbi:family 3 encapsulin nanocompartment shell protein [Luedemannella helvata]|uniref:Uncharacterized protein n=1 Tax=Luedemannella helvata TaxID=349315 RepID=A0ABN2JUR0_9ACTN